MGDYGYPCGTVFANSLEKTEKRVSPLRVPLLLWIPHVLPQRLASF